MLKRLIQDYLYKRAMVYYHDKVAEHSDPYRQWYIRHEDYKRDKALYRGAARGSEGALSNADTGAYSGSAAVVFSDRRGEMEPCAATLIERLFRDDPELILAYSDEDIIEDGVRKDPWFKPCFSPDTLASIQYYGHMFAIRREFLEAYDRSVWESFLTDTASEECYHFLLRVTGDILAAHPPRIDYPHIKPIGKVLIHMESELLDVRGVYEENIKILLPKGPVEAGDGAVSNISWEASAEGNPDESAGKPADLADISVIIPSKDNPGVLETCLSSFRSITENGERPQIIVVDNGSCPENKKRVEELSSKYNFTYIYRKRDFNFSAMCNEGAKASGGSYLLFLNDDMEIIQPDWLSKMLYCAALPHVGSVGAKLLYPGTDLIQHCGVTNIKAGPVHKLQKMKDSESHYHNQNNNISDMVAVTAACLLMSRENFDLIGGFKEGMAVSYNDVELCFSLLESDKYNVYRGDVALYHHESLSRGDDNLSEAKWRRLLEEKDRLYGYHSWLKSYDPFYSRNLAVHSNLYLADHVYDYEMRDHHWKMLPYRGKDPGIWRHEALKLNVEHARRERRLETTDREDVNWIEGWSYILDNDNGRYKRILILTAPDGRVYRLDVIDRYREDVVKVLPGQKNVELAGFVARFTSEGLMPGEYTVGMLAMDKCSRQKLFMMSEKTIEIL